MGTTMSNREVFEAFGDTIIYDLTILLCCSVIIFVVFRCAGCCEAYFKINSNNHIPGISISSKKYAVSLDDKHVYDCAFEPQATLSSIRQFIQRKAIWAREEIELRKYKTYRYSRLDEECEPHLLCLLPSENFVFILANGQPVPRNKESQWKLQYTMNDHYYGKWSRYEHIEANIGGLIRLSTPNNIHNFENTTIPWATCVSEQ